MSKFSELISFIRNEINRSINKLPIPESPKYLYDPIRYALKGRGKRLRPILTHLIGRALQYGPKFNYEHIFGNRAFTQLYSNS